jgi:hypothetical protein
VFQLKDIEKLGVKKGVIAQAIKDVLQSLVDDNLVCCEKIGVRCLGRDVFMSGFALLSI